MREREIDEFSRAHQFLQPHHFCFLKGKSTDTALFTHIEEITQKIESNSMALGAYLDLAKAFNMVNHMEMVSKLYKIGI